ncbi:MAG: TerB family tellurite resistance protein [Bacteroidales bacterium]|nr:TerB family tellurite resistance protein [Bacteroidales bacterium]
MKEKLSLITELIKLAKCDHEIREKEYQFISAVAQQLGISKKELDPLFSQFIEFTPPPFEFNRILQFQRLVLLMNIDGDACKDEMLLIRNLGLRLGLNPSSIETILIEMNKYPNKIIPPDILIEIFKQHYN